MNVVEATGVGKRYGSTQALRDCSMTIPAGHVAALIGPNGAGKSTLLNMAVGLSAPSEGVLTVLGGLQPGSPAALDGIAFVAQDTPLYRNASAADMLHLTRNLNRHFDRAYAEARLGELGIPLKRKAGKLSGGQQAQLALTLALARHPNLLVLDEPVAMLDPVARHDFMATVLAAAAEDGVSVLLSSHVLAELERMADYLILMSRGKVQVAGEVDELLAGHRMLTGPAAEAARCTNGAVVHVRRGGVQAHMLVRVSAEDRLPRGWESHPVGLEELALAYLRDSDAVAHASPQHARPELLGGDAMTPIATMTAPLHKRNDVSLRPLPWRRMAWVTWYQHRVALTGVVVALAAIGIYTWMLGLRLHHAYAAVLACHPAGSDACLQMTSGFNSLGGLLTNGWILQLAPPLIGAFVGAPVLAREMETGTFRYAWTQGFERWRWALAKLAVLVVAVTCLAGAMSLLFSWYYQPYFGVDNQARGLSQVASLAPSLFDLRGFAFAVWTLAAFAIGTVAGMVIRKVVPAIVATLAVYAGLAIATGGWLRAHYFAPILTTSLNVPSSVWIVGQNWTKAGHTVSQTQLYQVLQGAPVQVAGKGGGSPNLHALVAWQYLIQHGYIEVTSYQPAIRFWAFQWIEAGWLLGLSLLLISLTVWLVRRRVT